MTELFKTQNAQTGNSITGAAEADTALQTRENQKIRKSMGKFSLRMLRSTVFFIVAVFVVIFAACNPKAREQTEETDNFGIWEIKYFVDDFGEPTKEGYITTAKPIRGEYSLSTTGNIGMQVSFIVESEKSVSIKFYHAGNLISSGYTISYRVLVQDFEGERYTLSASNYDSDRLSFNHSDAKKVYNILLKGGTVKFKIYSDDILESEYSFTIDNADGFENAIIKLTGGSKPEKAENDVSSSTKNEDFKSFIQTFTSDKDFQLSRIKFPLNLVKSKDEWQFLGTNDIFEGVKTIKGSPLQGEFVKESENKYLYTLYMVYLLENDNGEDEYDGGELLFGIIFSKIDGEWMVTGVFNSGE